MPTENGFFHHFSTVNKPFWCPNQSFRSEQGFLKIGSQQQTTENGQVWEHGCTNHLNLEMEPKYLTRSDVQLNPNILRTKNKKKIMAHFYGWGSTALRLVPLQGGNLLFRIMNA